MQLGVSMDWNKFWIKMKWFLITILTTFAVYFEIDLVLGFNYDFISWHGALNVMVGFILFKFSDGAAEHEMIGTQ